MKFLTNIPRELADDQIRVLCAGRTSKPKPEVTHRILGNPRKPRDPRPPRVVVIGAPRATLDYTAAELNQLGRVGLWETHA